MLHPRFLSERPARPPCRATLDHRSPGRRAWAVLAVLLPLALIAGCQREPEQFDTTPAPCDTVTRATLDRIIPGVEGEEETTSVETPSEGFHACRWENSDPAKPGLATELSVELLRFPDAQAAKDNLADVRTRMSTHQELDDLGDIAVIEDAGVGNSPEHIRYVRAVRGNVYVIVSYENGNQPPDQDGEAAIAAARDVVASLG